MNHPLPRFLASFVLLLPVSSRDLAAQTDELSPTDQRRIAVLMRLTDIDVNQKPKLKPVVIRFLKTIEDDQEYLRYAERFRIPEANERLWGIAATSDDPARRTRAVSILLQQSAAESFRDQLLTLKDPLPVIEALGLVGSRAALELLQPLVTAESLSGAARNEAVKGLGRQLIGQKYLLELVESGKLPEECEFTAANVLLASSEEAIRTAAGEKMKLPAAAGSQPLAPLAELVSRRGDVVNGKQVFLKQGTCANCHRVAGSGKEVGPDLSEIGSKLSRQAMYESILNPSQAVSHNYETFLVQTFDGLAFSGILLSETDDMVVIRTAEAITKEISKDDIEAMKKSPQSLMPNDLQQNFSESDLVDLVEYLMTLKKKS